MIIKKAVFGQAIHIGSKTYTSLNTKTDTKITMTWHSAGYLEVLFKDYAEKVIVFPTNISYMTQELDPMEPIIEKQIDKTTKRARSQA